MRLLVTVSLLLTGCGPSLQVACINNVTYVKFSDSEVWLRHGGHCVKEAPVK